ncbi:unnamed protein product [Choristocarpus tenellus]
MSDWQPGPLPKISKENKRKDLVVNQHLKVSRPRQKRAIRGNPSAHLYLVQGLWSSLSPRLTSPSLLVFSLYRCLPLRFLLRVTLACLSSSNVGLDLDRCFCFYRLYLWPVRRLNLGSGIGELEVVTVLHICSWHLACVGILKGSNAVRKVLV